MINYNDDDTIPKKVKINDIKAFNKTAKIHALQTLVNSCKELDQRLVNKADFIKARNAIECGICQKNVMVKTNLNENGLCASCQKQIDKEKKEKAANALLLSKWKQLEKDLKKINKDYVFLILHDSVTIQRIVKTEKEDSIVFKIYREPLYSSSGFRHYAIIGQALKIQSDKDEIEANRLKKDFDGKNIAASLHKKIEKLTKEYELKQQKVKKEHSEKISFVKKIMKELKVKETDINNHYVLSRGRNHFEVASQTKKKVTFQKLILNVSIYNGNLTYRLSGVSIPLSLEQIKKIAKIMEH